MSNQDGGDNKVFDQEKYCALHRCEVIFCYKISVTCLHWYKWDIVSCAGAIMAELAERLLDVKKCDFLPGHKNNLANEFYCYSNFNFDKNLEWYWILLKIVLNKDM